jgi:Tol biopolymer transport system component
MDVAVVNGVPQGSNATLLMSNTVCCLCDSPAWSPLGDEITVGSGCEATLFVIDAISGAAQVLYTLPDPNRVVRSSAWRADGSQIAFVESDWPNGNSEIKILDRATLTVINTIPLGQFTALQDLDWARTQNKLAFSASQGGVFSVYTLNLPAGAPSFVINGFSPSFSPDDALLVFHDGGRVKTTDGKTLAHGDHPDRRR